MPGRSNHNAAVDIRRGGSAAGRVLSAVAARLRDWRFISKVLKWGALSVALMFIVSTGFVLALFVYHGSDPRLANLTSVQNYRPPVVTRLLSAEGHLIGELFTERRTVVGLDRIPETLIQATVAAEDARFFKHKGMDKLGMLRAFIANLRAGRYVQGGSTITQQVVKTMFLSPRRTLKRKVQELILARRLEQSLTKREILAIYLNQVYYGHGRYGVEEASRFYFGKSVQRVNLSEASLLAGLPQNPGNLSPLSNPKAAKKRQRYVLRRMVELGYITEGKARKVAVAPIGVVRQMNPFLGACPEIVDRVKAVLKKRFGGRSLSRLGLTVVTSCKVKVQRWARQAVRNGLRKLDLRQLRRARVYAKRRWARVLKGWALKRKSDPLPGQLHQALVLSVLKDGGAMVDLGHFTARLLPLFKQEPREARPARRRGRKMRRRPVLKPGKVLWVKVLPAKLAGMSLVQWDRAQAALVAIEPGTRFVRAMVGGRRFTPGDFNRAASAVRQPGSAFKPVLYAAALESRRFTPASILPDSPEVYRFWKPRNAGRKEFLGPVRLRVALAKSLNSVAIKLMSKVGTGAVRRLASRLGIRTPLAGDLSLALGSSGVTLTALTNAYAAFAARGVHESPRYIVSISGLETTVERHSVKVLEPSVAYVLTSMMRSVVREGTARRAARLGRPVAGKTGTTNKNRDAWFVGYAPQLAAGVWVGHDSFKKRKLGRGESGSRAALPVWVSFMERALRGRAKRSFVQPPGVVTKFIDPRTGLLASPSETSGRMEVFVQGTEPRETARPAQEVDPNEVLMETGSPSQTAASKPARPVQARPSQVRPVQARLPQARRAPARPPVARPPAARPPAARPPAARPPAVRRRPRAAPPPRP